MILIKDLTVSYIKQNKILDSLNISLSDNSIHGIVGLNGAGKTTLLNSIFGLKEIDAGEITTNNSKISRKKISYLTSESFFYSNITGREHLNLFTNKHFDIEEWNRLFLLPLDQIIDEYSTGMKKKLELLATFKQDKPIMILDEPFNGIDIETARVLRLILLRFKDKGKTIILTSHIIETLTNLCDYIHYLENGKIKYSKEKHEFAEFEKDIFQSIENKNIGIISGLI